MTTGATGASYDPSLSTNLDKIRFLIQDTDTTNYQLQDLEIAGMLSIYGSYKTTAVACCEVLAIKYGNSAELKVVGALRLSYADRAKKYMNLAKLLRSQVFKFVAPYVGGISQTDKEINQTDSDADQPFFKRNMQREKLPTIDYNDRNQ